MRIFQKGSQGIISLQPKPFANERELEDAIAETPDLLVQDGDPPVALVARQVRLDAGVLDVLLVDAEGTPVAVEAKLGRNGESRREVVGQVIDYVSTLTAMTVDELDRAVGGRLDVALRSLTLGDEADDQFERLWASVGINLRAGLARYVVAIDDPPPDLQRIVRFLAERSNLRVSLMGIQRYVDSAGQVIFVPQSNVAGDKVREAPAAAPKRAPSGDLQAVLDAYGAVDRAGTRHGRPGGQPSEDRATGLADYAPL